jgi:hypothetical protein
MWYTCFVHEWYFLAAPCGLNAWNMAKQDNYGFRQTLASSILKPLLVQD